MLAGAAARHDKGGHRPDMEIQVLPLDYPHSHECFRGAIDRRLWHTYLVSATLGGGGWWSHSWRAHDIHGCTHYHHDHHDGGSSPLLMDDKVQTFIITTLNLAALLTFCWNVLFPLSGLRWVRGECGQLVMRYVHFQCTGLVCRPDGLWRSGCQSGIILPTLTLKVDGQIMLVVS